VREKLCVGRERGVCTHVCVRVYACAWQRKSCESENGVNLNTVNLIIGICN